MCQGIISVSQSLIDGRLTISQSKTAYACKKQILHWNKTNYPFLKMQLCIYTGNIERNENLTT